MIPKLDLQSIINKYYLNGLNETVKWEIKDKTLTIKFTSPTREMIGEGLFGFCISRNDMVIFMP